jgi:3'-phosphoadenosine 5'-phosphosulfate (PAPS) 3'-phosphatase
VLCFACLPAGLLSRGDAGIFMRFPPASYREKIWDHCAGFLIVEEAGGKVRACICCIMLHDLLQYVSNHVKCKTFSW